MPRRSYRQFCSLAAALDRIGERWTLLVIRQLITGPKRFSDLLEDLRGIGTNLLSARLRQLELDGLVRRTVLPRPASGPAYELTAAGRDLDPAMTALSRWGARFLEPPRRGTAVRPGWLLVAMKAAARPEVIRGRSRVFQYEIEGETFHLRVGPRGVEAREGSAEAPDFVARMSLETLIAIARRTLDPADALARGAVELEGSEAAWRLAARVFDRGRDEPARSARPAPSRVTWKKKPVG